MLAVVAPALAALGFRVETGKRVSEKIPVPVLFGLDGVLEKSFDADAFHETAGMVVEVEAGRGVVNNQFLKGLFQACMMTDVTELSIAVRNVYRNSNDFERVCRFFDTLYASSRLQLPLHGVLVIGYLRARRRDSRPSRPGPAPIHRISRQVSARRRAWHLR